VNWGDRSATQDLGAITAATTVFHVFPSPGSYLVTGTVTDSFGTVSTSSISVTINPKPQPVVSLTPPSTPPTAGTDTLFTASVAVAPGSNTVIQDVTIDFGDNTTTDLGPTAGTIPLHHVYDISKTYTVTLKATDSNGGVGTATAQVFVQAATPLGVTLNASANIGVTQTIETFTATVTGLGNAVVLSYFWEFGNGDPPQTTTTNQITHAYVHGAITYTAKVTVTTSAPPPNNTATNTTAITP
jgi:immune inhibitor A